MLSFNIMTNTMKTAADVLVIGGGPAGLAVANDLVQNGLECIILEKGSVAHAISEYPTFMKFFSTKDLLEIGGFPLTIVEEKPSRRQYLNYLTRFVSERGLDVRTQHEVTSFERHQEVAVGQDGAVTLKARHTHTGEELTFSGRYLIVANGAWDHPRLLGIPGEDLENVSHRFTEAHQYVGKRVVMIGGRNSAIDIALELYRAGARVELSYRRQDFNGHGLKYWLKPDIENRLKNDEIGDHLGTVPVRIDPDSITLRRVSDDSEYQVPCDFVICMTGYEPDVKLLQSNGIEFEEESKKPVFDPNTYETNLPGVYVAGVIMQGNMSGNIFIENSREHGGVIWRSIKQYEEQRQSAETSVAQPTKQTAPIG
jgi:thioredoxin reductase (NADPH)